MPEKPTASDPTLTTEAKSLKIHPKAQRAISEKNIQRLYEGFNLDAIGTLHAVDYPIDRGAGPEDGPWIIDGQTRIEVLKRHGFGEWPVKVHVHPNVKDDKAAAQLFLDLNARRTVGPFDNWQQSRNAGAADAIGIEKIAEKYGLRIDKLSGDGHLACVSNARKAWSYDRGMSFDRALALLTAAWGRSSSAMNGHLVLGASIMCHHYQGALDTMSLAKKLAKEEGGASGFLGTAKNYRSFMQGTTAQAVADVLVQIHNRSRSSGRLEPIR